MTNDKVHADYFSPVKQTKPRARDASRWIDGRELAFSQGHFEPSWVERRELGPHSDWRKWVSTNLTPEVRDWMDLGLQKSSSGRQKCDKTSISSPKVQSIPPLTNRREKK